MYLFFMNLNNLCEFPHEVFIPLENNVYLEGRITINTNKEFFVSEVDIVFKESRKIWKHIGLILDKENPTEAFDAGMIILSNFVAGS